MGINNLNLSQQITNELGRAIISGHYTSQTGLPTEGKLCEQFKISRTAIREAVKMLAAKGLVTSRPRQGISIQSSDAWNLYDTDVLSWLLQSSPSLYVLKDFLQVRMAIEPQAAVIAAKRADKACIEKIAAASQAMFDAVDQADEAMHEADLRFHIAILYASGNPFFIKLREFIRTALTVSIHYTTPAKGSAMSIAEDHGKVYNAIASGDAERAKGLMAHLIDEAMVVIEEEIAAAEKNPDVQLSPKLF